MHALAGVAPLLLMAAARAGGNARTLAGATVPQMVQRVRGCVRSTAFGFAALFLASCAPSSVTDSYATATPLPASFDTTELVNRPVATLGFAAPANLQGYSVILAHALSAALAEATPRIPEISAREALNRLTDQRADAEYAELRARVMRNEVPDRQRLQRIGSRLGSHYVLLPGLAEFDEAIADKFEAIGIKLIRSRVTTLRLWLQLWEVRTGHVVWESAGELTAVTPLLTLNQSVPLEQIAQKLLLHMIQDGLLKARTRTRVLLEN
jgi:hypothetical protein